MILYLIATGQMVQFIAVVMLLSLKLKMNIGFESIKAGFKRKELQQFYNLQWGRWSVLLRRGLVLCSKQLCERWF